MENINLVNKIDMQGPLHQSQLMNVEYQSQFNNTPPKNLQSVNRIQNQKLMKLASIESMPVVNEMHQKGPISQSQQIIMDYQKQFNPPSTIVNRINHQKLQKLASMENIVGEINNQEAQTQSQMIFQQYQQQFNTTQNKNLQSVNRVTILEPLQEIPEKDSQYVRKKYQSVHSQMKRTGSALDIQSNNSIKIQELQKGLQEPDGFTDYLIQANPEQQMPETITDQQQDRRSSVKNVGTPRSRRYSQHIEKKVANQIQNDNFDNTEVQIIQKNIKTGEDAFAFFAKYGNSTPIKFINCVRVQSSLSDFRPYDLISITLSENQKEHILAEYYTISSHGIVHTYTEKGKRMTGQENGTEVIALSDWMHESTMFNIIRKILFFKHYTITKVFKNWKSNIKYKIFCNVREKLIKNSFFAKTAFVNRLWQINSLMYHIQNVKTISPNISNSGQENDEFKSDQSKYRAQAALHYENVIDLVFQECNGLINDVISRTQIKEHLEDEWRFSWQKQQNLPMNEVRKELEQRDQMLDGAKKDKEKLRNMIRLVDYILEETLYQNNQVSIQMLFDEMKKPGRKQALFSTVVSFDNNGQLYTPDETDVNGMLMNLLDDMILTVKNTTRIILKLGNYVQNEQHTKIFSPCDLQKMITESVCFQSLRKEIKAKVKQDFIAAKNYVNDNYEKCRDIYNYSLNVDLDQFLHDDQKIDQIKAKIHQLQKWNEDLHEFIKDVPKGVLQVEGKKIRSRLEPFVRSCLSKIKDQMYILMKKKCDALDQQLVEYNQYLAKPPTNLKDYADYTEFFQKLKDEMGCLPGTEVDVKIVKKKSEIDDMQYTLKQSFADTYQQKAEDLMKIQDINKEYTELFGGGDGHGKFSVAKQTISGKKSEMIISCNKEIEESKKKILQTITLINSGIFVEETTDSKLAIEKLVEIETKQIAVYIKKEQTLCKYQKLMDLNQPVNKDLNELKAKFADRLILWKHIDSYAIQYEDWYNGDFTKLDCDAIEREMNQFENTVVQLKTRVHNLLEKDKTKDIVLDTHTQNITKISKVMSVISALGNKDLKSRHWQKIFQKLDIPGQYGQNIFTLKLLMNQGVEQRMDEMEEISSKASGEATIELQLQEIRKKWLYLKFVVHPYIEYKDKYIIGSVDDIIATLDDHQLKVQTMLGTRFVTAIRSDVEQWESKLLLIQETIDEWLFFQKQWMYLENIFSAEDIQKQLPQETTKFQAIDKIFKELMGKANKRPLVQDNCNSKDIKIKIEQANQQLEEIQKGLDNYLETKRTAFPRFYFLSNDELLEILSQTRNPHAVQGHLRKCFDNISQIQFTEEEDSKEIIAMTSAQPEIMPETVTFWRPVFAEGVVEVWLMKIQEMMIKSLYDYTKNALRNYPEKLQLRKDWLFNFNYPAQPIIVVDQIKWTMGCVEAITNANEGNSIAVHEYYEKMKELITAQVNIVREDLNTLQRTLMGALIVIDVHARDVIQYMLKVGVNNLNDFEWSKQLRFYWITEGKNKTEGDCVAKQTNSSFYYSYEYLGNGPRLVITPLTDKCYITLTSAKHLQYGGAPEGPAGTGKTETTKDLAKAVATQCVVFNCSDGLDVKTMARYFSGLAQCGAWACFDEFNRIDIEVLSVIAQQILNIQSHIRDKKDLLLFEGREMPLNSRFGVFITMNPNYEGRTELPDNLKVLFRPIAMMIPDYALIAEIILFSEGFEQANILAQKMVKLYSLSSQQLSKQDHYDFGMRAVKSVLVMAGILRRLYADINEDVVLIRAIRDSNLPKFLKDDVHLFFGIIDDLFPGVEVPFIDYGIMRKTIENQLDLMNYSKPEKFLGKIIQLLETIMVRHGVMVVGSASTGKTTNINILAKTLTQLHKQGSQDFWHKPVHMERLNPKAVKLDELFGYTKFLTNEWTDGIAAKIIRENVKDLSDVKQWVVFDGPVDYSWTENMNTVLDDNRMLCLNNGQRIKLPGNFVMLFEVNDLASASPATVSRVGMVYMETFHLGWEPLVEHWGYKWRNDNKDSNDKVPGYIHNMVDRIKHFFQEYFKEIRDKVKEVIPSVEANLIQSCLHLMSTCWEDCKAVQQNFLELEAFEIDNLTSMVFIFAFIWSAGGNLHDNPRDNSRVQFSNQIRSKIMKIYQGFPYEREVYDFYPNYVEKAFKPWSEQLKDFKFNQQIPYFNILVPTTDTTKFTYLMQKLVLNDRHMLMMGETGVGKSVIVNDFIMSLDQEKYTSQTLNFSAQTSPKNLQDLFMNKDIFPRKKKDLIGPPAGRKIVIFIDDINMPATELLGAQPVNELLRQIIDNGGFYDLKKLFFIQVKDCVFMAACASPEGGRNHVTQRLFRHFNMIWAPELSQKSMETIFIQILRGFLSQSTHCKGIEKFTIPIVKSTVDIYVKISQELLPTPKKSHYTFNLRDISKIFQGVLMVKYEYIKEKMDVIQLWIHECIRVFSDRLVDEYDRVWLFQRVEECLHSQFEYDWKIEDFSNFLYGNYVNDQKDYCKIDNYGALPNKFNDYMNMYNSVISKPLNIVFFMDAIRHISRLLRILKQNRGNSLLIGVGGIGRQSVTRLASFIMGYNLFSIEITKGYKEPQWKEDIKKLLKSAGAKNQRQVFLFSDTQILREYFLEDINNLLNIGEVPNLWGVDDYEEILMEIRQFSREANISQIREAQLKFFIQLVRENLHIVLAFSPVGDKLRNRCRMFPSIVNCCAIDWFDKWTDEALHQVAIKEYELQDKLGLVPYAQKLSAISVKIHQDVIVKTANFYEDLKRTNYVTPTSYLEHMKLYFELLAKKQTTLPALIEKYNVGLETLKDTNNEVTKLQKQIIEFKPKLEQMSIENSKLLIELEGKTKIANDTAAQCQKETNEAQMIRDEVSDQRASCQKDLDEAMPILRKAQEAVKKIDKNAINEMKSMKNPPILVRLVMESCCLLLGDQEDWPTAQRVLSRMNFRESLLEFNVDQCEVKRWVKFKNVYLNNPDYNEAKIYTVSTAALSILQWAQASEKYYQVKKIVAPKQKRLEEAEAMLKLVEDNLSKKEAALKEVQDNVIMLQQNLEGSTRKALILKNQQEDAEVKLRRAEKLAGGLSGEAVRWREQEITLRAFQVNLTGNLLISSACISYLGVFTHSYRQECIDDWIQDCKIREIPVADDYTLARMLSEEEQLQKWQENGLPADSLSVDNGIYIFNSKRFPLIIDPQGQANRFIKNLGVDYVTRLQDPNFLKSIENSIRFGQKILIENIEEELDPSLEPVLLKQTTRKGAQLILRIGDQDIPYSSDFRLFMTSKMPNPHYIPEICIKTTVINFTVSAIGLEDYLLSEVVRFEKIELEDKRIKLIKEISQCKRQIQELEDRILRQINEATGRILEDEEVINTLDIAKLTSDTVYSSLEQSKVTSEEINNAREIYRPVAKRGSVLYFVIASLANIDPMYQYSLEFFIMLFKIRLEKAPPPPEKNKRIDTLVADITQSCYAIICRGLFDKDKLLYSFMIGIQINLESKEINQREWSYFLRGFPGELNTTEDQKYPHWCTEKVFRAILGLSKESTIFISFPDIINDSNEQSTFSLILKSKEPWDEKFPKIFHGKLNSFQKLLFLKILREDRLTQLVRKYVGETLGDIFTQSPRFDLKACYMDSTCITPIIFVLSPGADPIGYLHILAKDQLFTERFKTLSLGQGQGEIAKELIKSGRRNGDWVCLQNCHLAISWMSEFEYIQETQVENDTHPDFRLWLTSMPSIKFPVPVLQNGIKLTNEPPKGLRANMMDKISNFDEKNYYSNNKSYKYQKLLYSLAFFHSVILERKKFGAIGWNIQYEWMNSDFQTSQTQLFMNINEQPEIPYQTLTYIIATINYGGRVTDDKDDLCITALLNRYFNPDVFNQNYEFAPGGIYFSPKDCSLDVLKNLVKSMPTEDDPEIFGLHPNAQISYDNKVVLNFVDALILCQPRIAQKGGSLKQEDIVSQMANKLLQEIPEKLNIKKIEESQNSLEVFRYQEVTMINLLIVKIKITLSDLVKAIQGTIVMSDQLESIFDSFILKKVPFIWEKVAYPSLKPLASWIPDLLSRIEFMKDWVGSNYMHSYWISSFFFPQGFLTAAFQQYSRKTHIAIDTLVFRTEVRQCGKETARNPDNGVNIHGLYIEGCRWDKEKGHLEESVPLVLFEEIPVIWLDPVLLSEHKPTGYSCPLYKVSTRKGILSTTGHSTNFVMCLDLKTDKNTSYWVRRGVALLTMLDD